MENRVEYGEDMWGSVERIPFLKRFFRNGNYLVPLDYIKMNEYMGNILPFPLTADRPCLSSDINCLLEEAEKRGDL
jgi:hypothetical protein